MKHVLLALLAVAACRDRNEGTDEPSPLSEPPNPGETPDPTESKQGFVAVVVSKETTEVSAPYTSAATKLEVKLGDTVTEGQVLARLDERQLRQELDTAIAQRRTAQAAVRQAQVELHGANLLLEREKKAEAAGVGSHADVVAAEVNVQKAQSEVQRAQAAVDEQQTRVKQLEAHLKEMTLLAPRAGSVALIYVQDGARVEGGRPVVRLISSDQMMLKFAIPADKVNTVKPGDHVGVSCDQRTTPLDAVVSHVAPDLDSVAQMIIAEAELVAPPKDLTSGLTCRAVPARPPAPPKKT